MKKRNLLSYCTLTLFIILLFVTSSCSRLLGWGVLLWSVEDPPIPSGTILPVYIKSNIDQVWVAGIPEEYRDSKDSIDKFEIPLWQLELVGSKKNAQERAEQFAEYASSYAETVQDGLPIREAPDNNARRVYRLKAGQIIKILSITEGTPAISAAGTPLPGDWYKVLTEDGTTGYCFSYRLTLFEHTGGPLAITQVEAEEQEDPDLELVFSRTWSPDWYGTMVSSGRINIDELSQHWGFFPGQDTGLAHISLPNVEKLFSYTSIRSTGTRSWRFEDTPLRVTLRSDTVLAVQYTEEGSMLKTHLFVALPVSVEDIILQETERRKTKYLEIFENGPVFNSSNYGTLSFTEDGKFTWTGYNLLVPSVISSSALGSGTVDMRLFLGSSVTNRYDGAFTLNFDSLNSAPQKVHFMYTIDNQGFRIEYVPENLLSDVTVNRRASSPIIIYFFKSEY